MKFINKWTKTLQYENFKKKDLLKKLSSISKEYIEAFYNRSEIGFNVFTMSSEYYYRENFHSFIIGSFLDPNEKHSEKYFYLHNFIDLLNKIDKNNKINKSDFLNSNLFVEKYKIDILITDESSKKAIIIENKINNASDQPRQIPRYYNTIKKDYEVVAIVYLTLNSEKTPNKGDWSSEEILEIDKVLKILPAFDISNNISLHNEWLIPSIIGSKDINNNSILRQYGELIKFLNTNSMDSISLKKFFETLKEDNESLETAISIRNMLNDLPKYLAIRIEEKYKNCCKPFEKIWRYKERDTVFENCTIDDYYFKLDIWCSEDHYNVFFWEPNKSDFDLKKYCEENKIISLEDFESQNEINKVRKTFSKLNEEELFKFVDKLLEELNELKK